MEEFAYRQFLDLEQSHWWFRGRRAIFRELMERRIRPTLGSGPVRSLDLGCGVGGNLEMLAAHGVAAGIDYDRGALSAARARGFTRLARADGARLPFADGSFDVVTALDAIEHMDDDDAAVRECARVLRPGGMLFLSGPAYQFLYTRQDAVVHHRRRYTIGRVTTLFEAADLEIAHASYINVLLFPAIFVALLVIKLKQRLSPRAAGDRRSNASIRFPRPLNEMLAAIFSAEKRVVTRVRVPFGHSLVVIGRKRL